MEEFYPFQLQNVDFAGFFVLLLINGKKIKYNNNINKKKYIKNFTRFFFFVK